MSVQRQRIMTVMRKQSVCRAKNGGRASIMRWVEERERAERVESHWHHCNRGLTLAISPCPSSLVW
jgi:hypothetical protein